MFYLKRLLVIIIILLTVTFWFMGRMVKAEELASSSVSSSQVPYSTRGPHFVGTRSLIIDEQLPIILWYPTVQPEEQASTHNYPYELKLFPPFGAVTVGTIVAEAIPDAPYALAAEPYPLIILSPGFAVGSNTYGWLAEHLASYGFVVISPEHDEQLDPSQLWRSTVTRPQDIQTVLSFVDEQVADKGLFEGLIDVNATAVLGHSYGGYTTLTAGGARLHTADFQAICRTAAETDDPLLFLCKAILPQLGEIAELAGLDAVPEGLWPAWGDKRVKAIVSLAGDAAVFGETGLAEISVPVMTIGGTADVDSPYEWSTQLAYESASSERKVQIGLVDAEHMIFTGRCDMVRRVMNFVPYGFCSDPAWEKDEAHDLIKQFTTAFLLVELKQDTEATSILAPETVRLSKFTYDAEGY